MKNLDSLRAELPKFELRDSNRVQLIFKIVEHDAYNPNNEIKVLLAEAIEISSEINYEFGIGYAHHLLGNIYQNQTKSELALKSLYKSIEIYEKLKAQGDLINVYVDLSNVYVQIGDSKKASEICEKAFKVADQMGATSEKARLLFYIGKSYDKLEDFNAALKLYETARDICLELNFEIGIVIANSAIAHIYVQLEEYEKGLPLLLESKNFYEKYNQVVNLAGTFSTLGECYLGLKRYELSVVNFEAAIKAYLEIESTTTLKFNYLKLAQAYTKLNNSVKAYLNYEKAIAAANAQFEVDKTKAIEELRIKFETNQIEQQRLIAESKEKLANKEKTSAIEKGKLAHENAEKSKVLSFLAIGFSILTAVLLWFVYRRFKVSKRQKKELDLAYLKLEDSKKNELAAQKLKVLKSQMNPHFIFNSLNSIQDLVLKEDTDKSYDYLVVFADLVRSTLNYSDKEFIPIEKELKFIDVYLSLEKLRFGDDFNYQINYDGSRDAKVPSLVIQPFIENALLHGLMHKKGIKILTIDFKCNSHFTCTITDNGVGRKKSKEIKSRQENSYESFSTKAIQKRMNILSEQYQTEAMFEYEDLFEEGTNIGTKVTIKMPFEKF